MTTQYELLDRLFAGIREQDIDAVAEHVDGRALAPLGW